MSCECCIGIINDYDNTRMATVEDLKEHIQINKEIRKPYHNWKTYELLDYYDKRKRTDLTRFNYCPLCGKKIDWKALKGGAEE